jgi:hypothetical protein
MQKIVNRAVSRAPNTLVLRGGRQPPTACPAEELGGFPISRRRDHSEAEEKLCLHRSEAGGGDFGPDGRYFVGLRTARTIMAFAPTLGDAILDRVVHCADHIELKGPSLRKRQTTSASAESGNRTAAR